MAEEEKLYSVKKEIKTIHFSLLLRSDGIVQLNTAADVNFTMKETMEYMRALEEITGGKLHLVLKVPGAHANVDNETRKYMASEGLKFSIAEAVIVRNLAQRMVGNFYIKYDKPKVPVRLFTKFPEAENWLMTFSR
jgi:hypothetical protein